MRLSAAPSTRALFTFFRNLAAASLTCALVAAGAGCGSDGGTSGSGGGSQFFISGVLRTTSQAPVAGVQVAVVLPTARITPVSLSAGAEERPSKAALTATTDSQGSFSLTVDAHPDTVTLRFFGANFDSTFAIAGIPQGASSVALGLTLDPTDNSISEESEQYLDDEGSEVREESHSGDALED